MAIEKKAPFSSEFSPFTVDNALKVAEIMMNHIKKEDLKEKIMLAWQNKQFTNDKVYLYIPCPQTTSKGDNEKSRAQCLEEFLENPSIASFSAGIPAENKGIPYTTWDEALAGRTILETEHDSFLIYDGLTKIIVDYVDRNGESLLNKVKKEQYLLSMRSNFIKDLTWQKPESYS